jgi:hypothetical protein
LVVAFAPLTQKRMVDTVDSVADGQTKKYPARRDELDLSDSRKNKGKSRLSVRSKRLFSKPLRRV